MINDVLMLSMFLIEKPKNSFMMIKPQVKGEIQGDINVNLSRESIGLASVQREMSDPDQQN